MWRSAFAEVDPELRLRSDVFLTQREVSAVFHGDCPVGLMMYDFRDLRMKAHRDMSYFKHYPSDVLEHLLAEGQEEVMMTGQLTVHPDWRKSKIGPFMSDVLMGLSVKRFVDSSASIKLACTRNDRGIQNLCYRFGAVPLRRGHEAYGIPCDVVAFHKGDVRDSDLPGLARIIDRLWTGTSVARLFSNLPPALDRNHADNDLVVIRHGGLSNG
jgi:hypothetical protein